MYRLAEAIEEKFGKGVNVEKKTSVHGGDANDAYALSLSDGSKAFLKANRISNADFFRAEKEGIDAIRSTGTIRVPEIYAAGIDEGYSFLLMEHIGSAGKIRGFWDEFGRKLAAMHKAETTGFVSGGRYGFKNDNYIGAGYQKNECTDSWTEFFAEQRLRYQFKNAERYFDSAVLKKAERLLDTLDRFLYEPEQPSILHGDLWAGNFMSDEKGEPMLIDPAVYVGCNEADIAMTELFGGFDRSFYISYFDEYGKEPGYEDRRDLYNLYHLTNHLNLFGSSYLSSVVRIIEKYQ